MNKLKGVSHVFKFTFIQHYKSKGTILTLVFLFLFSFLSMPVISLISGSNLLSSNEIEKVYIRNSSGINVNFAPIKTNGYEMLQVEDTELSYEQLKDELAKDTAAIYVDVSADVENGVFRIDTYSGKEENANDMELTLFSQALKESFEKERIEALGLSEQKAALIINGYSVEEISQKDYATGKGSGFTEESFGVSYVIALVLVMLVCMSAAYIIRSVVEEKSTKLVDLLLVSVDPIAIIVGKIGAVISYLFIGAVGVIISTILSNKLSNALFGIQSLATTGESFSIAQIMAYFDVKSVFVLVAAVFLALLNFSVLSGISGVCCSGEDDIQSGSTLVMTLGLIGYMLSSILPIIGERSVYTVCSLIPLISIFCAPSSYILGNISGGIMAISFAINLVVGILLALLTGRVYKALITYNGKRIKFKQLMSILIGLKSGGAK